MNARSGQSTIVGVFNDRAQAQQAINELKRAGFTDDQIGVTTREGKIETVTDADSGDTYGAEGAVAGIATGAGMGALWGLGILSGLLPGIGPAIAGGTLAALLSSAAAGAAAAGLAGALIGMGMSKEDAEFYESEFKAGRTIVTLHPGSRATEALAIIRRYGGYERSTAAETRCSTTGSGKMSGSCSTGTGERTVQAVEEQLHVNKDRKQVGEVTVRKEVHTEHKTIEVPVEREEVVIERHAVSGRAATGVNALGEGQQIRIPVSEEQVEVNKSAVVKEEVTVGKRKVKDTEKVSADLRKEEIKVERDGDVRVKDDRR
jgi:uncharacterized protein (TIGR02271 family)